MMTSPGDKMTPVPGKDRTTPPPDERDWPSITHLSGTPASRMIGHDTPPSALTQSGDQGRDGLIGLSNTEPVW